MSDDKDSEESNSSGDPKPPPANAVVDEHQHVPENPQPAAKASNGKLDSRIAKCWRRCKSAWRKTKLHERVGIIFEGIGLAALIVYTIFSVLQWAQIRWTNRLTREALNGSDKALTQTLERLDRQITATKEANDLTRAIVKGTHRPISASCQSCKDMPKMIPGQSWC
jgi:hypothetical protein